jgi:hypothetical protein
MRSKPKTYQFCSGMILLINIVHTTKTVLFIEVNLCQIDQYGEEVGS